MKRLCHKCRMIIRYGPAPICGHYKKTVPGVEFAGKCKFYQPYEELENEPEEALKVLLKESPS